MRDFRGFDRAWRRVFESVGHFPSLNLIPSKQVNGKGGIMLEDGLALLEIDLTAHRGDGG